MDIVVKTLYYHLATLDGKFTIYAREEITSPPLSVHPVGVTFGSKEDADEYVKWRNEQSTEQTVHV